MISAIPAPILLPESDMMSQSAAKVHSCKISDRSKDENKLSGSAANSPTSPSADSNSESNPNSPEETLRTLQGSSQSRFPSINGYRNSSGGGFSSPDSPSTPVDPLSRIASAPPQHPRITAINERAKIVLSPKRLKASLDSARRKANLPPHRPASMMQLHHHAAKSHSASTAAHSKQNPKPPMHPKLPRMSPPAYPPEELKIFLAAERDSAQALKTMNELEALKNENSRLTKKKNSPNSQMIYTGLVRSYRELITAKHLDMMLSKGKSFFPEIRKFCEKFPKIELHNHLAGSIFAMTYINLAVEKGYYVDVAARKFYEKSDGDSKRILASQLKSEPKNIPLLNELVNSMSADVEKLKDKDGHLDLEQYATTFFASFAAGDSLTDTWLISLKEQLQPNLKEAERQNVVYTEYMKGIWTGDAPEDIRKSFESTSTFPMILDKVLKCVKDTEYLAPDECDIVRGVWELEAPWKLLSQTQIIHNYVGNFVAKVAKAHDELTEQTFLVPKYRLIAQVFRHRSDAEFFVDMAAAMHFQTYSKMFVGVTIAGREDVPYAVMHFDKQMQIINYLYYKIQSLGISHAVDDAAKKPIPHKWINLTLHAGEFRNKKMLGIAPPSYLPKHVGNSVEVGHASRIGQGVTMTDDERAIVKKHNALIEVCPSSNQLILGVELKHHPVDACLNEQIDISINSDDAAVNKTTLSDEWKNFIIAFKHKISWVHIKNIMRGSAEHVFLPGESIYLKDAKGKYNLKPEFACVYESQCNLSDDAKRVLAYSEKAQLQKKLELEFVKFEDSIVELMKKLQSTD